MVIPARWFSGGMGLDEFRASMLGDSRLRVIEDFPDSNDVFPGTQIKGGVCYFLWNRENSGKVKVTTHDKGSVGKSVERPLLEHGADVFIRYNEAIPILKKVIAKETNQSSLSESISIDLPENKKFMRFVSSIGAFG
jgi:site-specific DNA-methyltransferase (adenine-specific)